MPRRRPAVTIPQLGRILSRAIGIHYATVPRWTKKGWLPLAIRTKGKMIVKREIAIEILNNWRRTCSYSEAARLLGIPKGSVGRLVRLKIVESIYFFRTQRIVRDSIPLAKGSIGKDVIYANKIGFARYSHEKIREIAKRARESPRRRKLTLEDYQRAGRIGGRISQDSGRGHRWTAEEARNFSKQRKNTIPA